MSKFTPGPWKATHCTVSAPETEDRLGFSINVRNGNRDDTRANARLIAAAPELLAACEAFLASDKASQFAIVGHDSDGHPLNASGAARGLIRAAIAKATGAAK